MKDKFMGAMRKMHRERMHDIWELAKSGDLDVLDDEERRFGEIMLEHADEFFNQFEFADVLGDHEFDPDSEVNPFFHIILHVVVENQLEAQNPIEAYQFYNTMRKKKVSRHETIHLIATMLAPMIFRSLQRQETPDMEKYKAMLKKYKTRKPEKVYDALDQDMGPL